MAGQAWALATPPPDRAKWPWLRRVLGFLNSGQPFGIKEHVVASLIASSGNNGLSGVEIYAVERLFYERAVSVATTAVLGTFSISLCGFVLAGVLRPLIVYPAEMVYWSALPQVVLFQNLHFDRRENRSRLVKFGWALAIAAAWQVLPAYLVTSSGLAASPSSAWRRWVRPTQRGVSPNKGLGLLNVSLDWQYIQSGFLSLPHYGNTSWIWSSIAVGVLSQLWLRRKLPRIYNKYNYLIGAALDGGSQTVIFVLSFAVFGASGQEHPFPAWWGNPEGSPDHCL